MRTRWWWSTTCARSHDLREVYNPDLPNPVSGVSSRDFARIAAEVYAAMGVRVFFPEQGFLSTPELSFAIRRLGATAGLNISASHNHPDDNGGKFYNRHGAQHVPPRDEELAELVDAVREIRRMPFDEATRFGVDRADPRRAAQGLRRPERRPVARAARARRARGVHAAATGPAATRSARCSTAAGFRVDGVRRGGRARRRVPRGAVPRAQPRGARIDGARGARGRGVRRRARDGVRSRRGPDRHLRARARRALSLLPRQRDRGARRPLQAREARGARAPAAASARDQDRGHHRAGRARSRASSARSWSATCSWASNITATCSSGSSAATTRAASRSPTSSRASRRATACS